MQLSDGDRHAWLRLARTRNVGPVTFLNLIARFGSASSALEQLPRLAIRGGSGRGGNNFVLPPEEESVSEQAALAKLGGRLIASREADFPLGLKALEAPPPVLSALGHPHLPQKKIIAIVGARNASALARNFAETPARELGFAGLVVVSGLARDIDAAVREAALAVGTVAVAAGGMDIIHPPENEKRHAAISNQGVTLSEMRLGKAPKARNFPRRNRINSGLARRGPSGSGRKVRFADNRRLCAETGPRDLRRARSAA